MSAAEGRAPGRGRRSARTARVDRVGELLMRTVEEARAVYADAYEAQGLTERQWLLLRRLRAEDDPPTVGQLGEWLGSVPPATTALVDRLERRGLVERGADPGDRRRRRVGLTEAGEATLATVDEVAAERSPCRELSGAQLGELEALLTRMLESGAG